MVVAERTMRTDLLLCASCGMTFIRKLHSYYGGKVKQEQRYCSRECVGRDGSYSGRWMVLRILQESRHTWMTISDLSIWVYGDDTDVERTGTRTAIYRLRKMGYRIESRDAPWDRTKTKSGQGRRLAYRLAHDERGLCDEGLADRPQWLRSPCCDVLLDIDG